MILDSGTRREFDSGAVRDIQEGKDRCDQCKRGDCDSCVYKGAFERLMELPNCNDCALNASSYSCNYRPRIGENARINCPMWKPKEEARQ